MQPLALGGFTYKIEKLVFVVVWDIRAAYRDKEGEQFSKWVAFIQIFKKCLGV